MGRSGRTEGKRERGKGQITERWIEWEVDKRNKNGRSGGIEEAREMYRPLRVKSKR